jgi:hypothetical protein
MGAASASFLRGAVMPGNTRSGSHSTRKSHVPVTAVKLPLGNVQGTGKDGAARKFQYVAVERRQHASPALLRSAERAWSDLNAYGQRRRASQHAAAVTCAVAMVTQRF